MDYWMETGAVLILGYLVVLVNVGLAIGVASGIWPLGFFLPVTMALLVGVGAMWVTRPSI